MKNSGDCEISVSHSKDYWFLSFVSYETERNDLVSLLELNFRRDERVMRYPQ